jgi:hypothetical protein
MSLSAARVEATPLEHCHALAQQLEAKGVFRSESVVKAEALREAADTANWPKIMSPYRWLRERADELEAGRG